MDEDARERTSAKAEAAPPRGAGNAGASLAAAAIVVDGVKAALLSVQSHVIQDANILGKKFGNKGNRIQAIIR